MNILNEHMNKLLKRREIVLNLEQTSSPAHAHVLELVASHFKVAPEQVAVKKIGSHYGSHHFTIEAFVYDSPELKQQIEPRVKAKKAIS
ncbi:MAG: hypothetical protein AABY02_01800 [Nanoarchaeota archaeon]